MKGNKLITCRVTITVGDTERFRTFEWKELANGPFLSQLNEKSMAGNHPTFPYTLSPFVCDFAIGSLKNGVFEATFRTQSEDGWATAFAPPDGVVGDIIHYLISFRSAPPTMNAQSAPFLGVFIQMGLRWAVEKVGLLPVVMTARDLENFTLMKAVVRQALSRLPQTSDKSAFADEMISLLEKRQAFLIILTTTDYEREDLGEMLSKLYNCFGMIVIL